MEILIRFYKATFVKCFPIVLFQVTGFGDNL